MSQNKNNEEYDNTFKKCHAKGLLDTSDIMALFKNSERTVERWRQYKILKFKKIKGRCYYKWVDILPLLY